MKKILATPRSFGKNHSAPIRLLEEAGYQVVLNPLGKILTADEMKEHLNGVTGIIVGVDSLNAEVLSSARALKAIAKYGVGTDNIDLVKAKELHIPVSVTTGANSDAVSDYAFALIMACTRRLVTIDQRCHQKDWSKITTLDVYGKTLGILGLGSIGKGVAQRAKGFCMDIKAYDVRWDDDFAKENNIQYACPDEIFSSCDFISLHLPLTGETKHMIGAEQFAMMKRTAVLVNTARGGIIDEQALVNALKEEQIYAAGIDAFSEEPPSNEELYKLDNLIMGSHCAASTVGAIDAMSMMAAQNLINDLRNIAAAQAMQTG